MVAGEFSQIAVQTWFPHGGAATLLSETHVADDVYQVARKQFSEVELVNLTMAIVAINGWNRLEVSFRGIPE
jgi:alkylhydroperoxidase family enzyme